MSTLGPPTAAPATRPALPTPVFALAILAAVLMLVSLSRTARSFLNPPPEATDLPQRVLYVLGLAPKALILQHLSRVSPTGAPARRLVIWSASFWVAINIGLLLTNATISARRQLYDADSLLLFYIALGAWNFWGLTNLTKKPTRPDDLD